MTAAETLRPRRPGRPYPTSTPRPASECFRDDGRDRRNGVAVRYLQRDVGRAMVGIQDHREAGSAAGPRARPTRARRCPSSRWPPPSGPAFHKCWASDYSVAATPVGIVRTRPCRRPARCPGRLREDGPSPSVSALRTTSQEHRRRRRHRPAARSRTDPARCLVDETPPITTREPLTDHREAVARRPHRRARPRPRRGVVDPVVSAMSWASCSR